MSGMEDWTLEMRSQGTRGPQFGAAVQRMLKSFTGAGRTWAGGGRTGPKALEGGRQEGQLHSSQSAGPSLHLSAGSRQLSGGGGIG